MKHFATVTTLLLTVITWAPTLSGMESAGLPECSGFRSRDIAATVKAAKEDPARTYRKAHPEAASSPLPARTRCESALWRSLHAAKSAANGKSQRGGPSPSATVAHDRKSAPALSPAGRRAIMTVPGQKKREEEERRETNGVITTDPPNDLRPVPPVLTPPLRALPPIAPPKPGDDNREGIAEPIRPPLPIDRGDKDTVRQSFFGPIPSAPTATGVSFEGVGTGIPGFTPSGAPPDTNGHVGATQYVQWNNTSFAVWDKSGTRLYGPVAGNTLFQSLGGACASHNDGDPVVNYDALAGRWVLSQFVVGASPNYSHQCVAVSVTGDATGAWNLYDFVTDALNFVDYPHMGVWPDGYYMTAHVFNAAGSTFVAGRVYVFERDKMLLGQAARQLSANLPAVAGNQQFGILPADLDGLTLPPAGEAEFVVGPHPTSLTRIISTRVSVTWGVTPAIALSATSLITVASPGNPPCANNTAAQDNRDCVPQPSPAVGADYLDNVGGHFMYRLAYRNFGGSPVQESLVAVQTGGVTSPSHTNLRWYELRNAGSSTTAPTVFQSGTYDPDSSWRWMGSIAMDKDQNIALGYSKSSTAIKPGIFMTGRLATDTINTMGAEATVMAGGGSQIQTGNRWGDYSNMTVDPIDQCTFWYTNEYLPANGSFNWATRIASYKFPSCTPAPAWGTVSGTITECATGTPLSGVVVSLSNGFSGASDASGHYSISVPAGTYTATAADTARNCASSSPASNGVTVGSGGTTTQNFCMSGTSNLQFSTVAINDAPNGNNNGIVNANECVNLGVTVKNNGCANETAIAASLTTSTTGVTITQGNSAYSDLAIDASGANSTPFKFQTSASFVCGTVINFTLNLTYTGGSKAIGISVPTCAGGANQSIPTSSITLADLSQPDRLGRDGVPSTCSGKACPGAINSAGTRNYKKFTFTNSGGAPACITVQLNAACGSADVESAAYLNSYTPPVAQGDATGNLCLGYLGDSGISGLGTTVPSSSYSFQVAANSNFVVVVSTATGSTTCTQFSGTVSGFFDFTPGPGACPCTPPATPTASNTGPYCPGATISLSTPAVSGATYAWTGPGGFTSALQNPTRSNASTADAGTYSVTVTVAGCTSAAGTTSVVVNPTPATPAASNTGPYCVGGTISLSTPAVAGATYAWTGPGGFTSALQNPTRSGAATADAGTYSVTVTVSGCTSAAGSTSVVVNPIPATPTASNTGPYCAGATISLSTPTASGATYAWTGPNGFTSALQNPTRASATTADAGTYSVTVTVSGCTSAAGTTSVVVNPTPATPTASNTGPYCAGATISLSTPTVAGATYAWTGPGGFTSSLQNPTRSGAATADAGTYSVTVTVGGCTSAAGSTSVVVNPIPATPAASNTGPYCVGATISLSTPTVAGATYAWTGPGGFTSALQNPTRSNAGTADAGTYSVTITVSGCTSAAGTTNVTVNPVPATPTITPGGPTTFCAGGSVTLTSSSASGNQWNLNGNPIGGATNNTYSATASGDYTVTVTASGCTSAASAATTVTVNPIPATPTITPGGPTTFCTGGSVTLTSSSASGNQWYLNGNPIGGATNNTFIASASGSYTVQVTSLGCTSSMSLATTVTVNPIPATPTITPGGPTTFCAGGSVTLTSSSATGNQWLLNGNPIGGATNNTYSATASGNYTVTVTTSGCTSAASAPTSVTVTPLPATPTITPGGPTSFCTGGSVTLTSSSATGNQWLLNGNPIGGATNNTFVATASGNYTVTVTAGGCTSAASAPATVTVSPVPATPTITPGGPTTFCSGDSVTLTSSSASGNQWSLNGNPIGGATGNSYIAIAAGDYTVTVTTAGCASAPSAATTVTVNPAPPTPTITPGGPTTFCTGSSVLLTSSSASGNQWLLNGNPIGGATNNTFLASASGNYTVTVTAAGCTSLPSLATTVTVNPIPATPAITPGGPTTFCTGGSVTLTSSSASGNQWFLNGNPIGGATSNTYIATATGNYTVTVTTSGCTSAASAATSVTVNPIPATPAITPGGPTTFCAGGSVTLTSSSASGNQWLLNGNPIGGATNNTFNATASGNYTVTVTASGCTSAASAATSVTVNPIPATPTITPGGPTTFCAGGSVTLTSSSASGNQWFLNGNPIGGATNNTYSATASGNYTVTVTTSGCTSAASAATSVTVNPIPATPTITPGGPTTFCSGGSVTLTSSNATGNQWYLNGNPIGGATSQTYNANTAGDYSVRVTSSGCTSAASAANTVTINPNPNATITVSGSMVSGSSAPASVASAGAGATYTWSITNGTITAGTGTISITFTAGAAGTLTLNVTVTTAAGCSDAKSANVTVTPVPPPVTITSIVPNHGRWIGGTPVTINGTGFLSGATVTIGGNAATSVVVVNSTRITATTPAHAAATVAVTVTNPDSSTFTAAGAFTYTPQQFDPNGDAVIDPADIFYLVNYLFTNGPAPTGAAGMLSGDANGDGVVDPADIFYAVNYLFTNGPQPMSGPLPPRSTNATSSAPRISGAISLGSPVAREGRWVVPVILTLDPDSAVPQALALKVRGVRSATIRRAGAAGQGTPVFEISRSSGDELSYIVAGVELSSSVIAEIEVATASGNLEIDATATMLSNLGGTRSATVAGGTLAVSGTTIDRARPREKRERND